MHTQDMIGSHPDVASEVNAALIRCIDEAYACAQACISCADACLAEDAVAGLRQCIRLNLDCADVCAATGALASRRTGSNPVLLRETLKLCANACHLCGEECRRHATEHEHCRICADACQSCEDCCRQAVGTIH